MSATRPLRDDEHALRVAGPESILGRVGEAHGTTPAAEEVWPALAARARATKEAPGQHVDFEFLADNPGHWFFHCHNLYHLAAGMARVFHYGVDPGGIFAPE